VWGLGFIALFLGSPDPTLRGSPRRPQSYE
jgi:hypothetical protein